MMLPVIEALTTSVWPARSATVAIISSAALPKVAFRNPPSVGPDRRARCSVAVPINPAAGTRDTAASTNTHTETPDCQRSARLSGAATRSTFNQLAVNMRSSCVSGVAISQLCGMHMARAFPRPFGTAIRPVLLPDQSWRTMKNECGHG